MKNKDKSNNSEHLEKFNEFGINNVVPEDQQ